MTKSAAKINYRGGGPLSGIEVARMHVRNPPAVPKEAEQDQEKRLRPQPLVEEKADPAADDDARDKLGHHPETEVHRLAPAALRRRRLRLAAGRRRVPLRVDLGRKRVHPRPEIGLLAFATFAIFPIVPVSRALAGLVIRHARSLSSLRSRTASATREQPKSSRQKAHAATSTCRPITRPCLRLSKAAFASSRGRVTVGTCGIFPARAISSSSRSSLSEPRIRPCSFNAFCGRSGVEMVISPPISPTTTTWPPLMVELIPSSRSTPAPT